MGQSESSFKKNYEDTVSQLSTVQLGEIATKFNELYAKAGGRKGHVVDREAFSEYFHLPVAIGDRLFDAFDEQKNGKISFEEFVCGLALVLHGSFSDKCYLLFRVFNLNEDEGISRTELATMLTAILHSTHTILYTVADTDKAVMGGEDIPDTVRRMVDAAFTNCDISRTGKLLPLEFEYWLKRNPKILDSLLSFKTKECTLGPLIMSPSEQQLSHEKRVEPVTVTMEPSSPTLFQLGAPEDDDHDELTEQDGSTTELTEKEAENPLIETNPPPPEATVPPPEANTLPPECDVLSPEASTLPPEGSELAGSTKEVSSEVSPADPRDDVDGGLPDQEEEEATPTVTELVTTPTDQAGSIMHEESSLSIDMSCVPRVTSTDKLGPASPVLPTTAMESVVMTIEEEQGVTVERSEVEGDSQSFGSDELATEAEQELDSSSAVQLAPSISESLPLDEGVPLEGEGLTLSSDVSVKVSTSPFPELEEEHVRSELHSSWVMSPWTRQLFNQQTAGQHLTCPALVADIKLNDQVSDLLAAHFPDEKRKPLLSVENVSMNGDGLRKLVASGSLHAALELTGRFLSAHGQGLGQAGQPTMHTEKTLHMWCSRIALLVHLQMYKDAENELQAFGEMLNPDLYYEFHTHSYPGKTGSMVPFSLRLVHAHLPALTDHTQQALDRLCSLQGTCELVLSELRQWRLPGVKEPLTAHDQQVALSLWKNRLVRVKTLIANTFVSIQDYHLAIEVYERLVQDLPTLGMDLYSAIGRLHLHVGDVLSAQRYFTMVSKLAENDPAGKSTVKINEALVNVFLARWHKAGECFAEVLNLDPSNQTIKSNLSVCTFYQGRLKEAIKEMETLLTSDPPHTLQPTVLANLAAAYELESGNSLSKKANFIPLLAQHVHQGFHINSLNIKA